jgi:membrane associated rhomboid family serine protease
MRQPAFGPRRSATLTLVIINAVVFILQVLLIQPSAPLRNFYYTYFPLSLSGLMHGYVWQLLTYQFMHADFWHVLFNCWVIYMFGIEVEQALGRKSFLTLYFASGVIGGLMQAAAGFIPLARFYGSVVGASAAGFGVTAAFAMLFPDRILLLFFIIPMRARFLLVLSAVIAIFGILAPYNPSGVHMADVAHLGGMLTGVLFVRYALHWDWHWPKLRRARGQSQRRLVKVSSGNPALWGRGKGRGEEELPAEEFLSKEVDPILDKISAQGIQSLTERERRILEAARERMGKR